MKNLRYFIVGITIFFSTSCGDDFLEVDLINEFDENNFFSTESQVFQGLVATYDPLQWSFLDGRWTSSVMLGDIRSDNATAGGDPTNSDQLGWQQMDDFLEDEFLIESETFWKKYYSGIRRANLVINQGDLGTDLTNQYLAEAKFLRAYYHFELFRTYGPIPVVTEPIDPTSYVQTRNTISEVFDQVIRDLRQAIPLLPNSFGAEFAGRVTSGAANGLLGKAYLYYADVLGDNQTMFDSAAFFLNNVITSGDYQLVDDYNELFAFGASNSTESVFEIQHSGLVPGDFSTPGEFMDGNAMVQLSGIRGLCANHPEYDAGWGFMLPTSSLFDSFLSDDTFRRDASIVTPAELAADGCSVDLAESNPQDFQGYWQQKYANYNGYTVPNGGEINLLKDANQTYMRYADVLLMAAEALERGSGSAAIAMGFIDEVRERGAGPGDNAGSFRTASQLMSDEGWTLLEVIWYERRVELALEGDRWFDLVRSGRLESSLWAGDDLRGANVDPSRSNYLPIPQREVIATNGALSVYPEESLFN
ncbi:MAG: RagB/SusD family nutrient uptake outer membrane protein [Ekhidna sp.]